MANLGINAQDMSKLELPFTEDEVWRTIQQLPSDKAPGPDGYIGRFYKPRWAIIKEDIMVAISAVWSRKMVNFGTLNSAYITLLPKKEGAEQPKDFRPISLVHSFAKLITKLLANRLAPRLPQIVSPNQSAFIKGVLYNIISCWFRRHRGSYINKSSPEFYSSWTFRRHLILCPGPSYLRSCSSLVLDRFGGI